MESTQLNQELRQIFVQLQQDQSAKFKQSIDVCFSLNLKRAKKTYVVRNHIHLPHAKQSHVAALVENEYIDLAKQYGAKWSGNQDLLQQIKNKQIKPTHVVATQSCFKNIPNIGKILGSSVGLLPKEKTGTLVNIDNLESSIAICHNGLLEYKSDPFGAIRLSLGKIDDDIEHLINNFLVIYKDINQQKPQDFKGSYWRSIHFATTMGKALYLNLKTK